MILNNLLINEILINYITYKDLMYLYLSCKKFYNFKFSEKKLEKIYYTPKIDKELYDAIKLWKENKSKSDKLYGEINRWNTKNITNMQFLLYDINNFNEDINDWIVYNVKDFRYIINSKNKKMQKYKKNIKLMKELL